MFTDYSVGQSIPTRPPFDCQDGGVCSLVWSFFTEDISRQPVNNEDEVIVIIPAYVLLCPENNLKVICETPQPGLALVKCETIGRDHIP